MNQLLQDHNEYSSGFLQFAPEVIVEVTSSCDRKCRGCYAPNKVMDRTQAALDLSLHLSPAMLSNALRALSEPGAQIGKTIAIRGGEPTLNPMLPELLPTLQKVGEQLFLETHGRWLISAGIRNDGLDTLINSLRESGTTLKISYDRMHAMNPTILRQMTDAADSHGLPWCLAITTATVDELYELCKNIPWVPTSRIVYQPLAKEASELIKAKNSVISADGTTSKSLTHRFIENVVKESKPLLVVLISMLAALSGFSFDASAAGKASGAEKPLQNVQIGLASNFSSVSSSNSNPFGNYFLDGVTLALDESCTGGHIAHRITNIPGASAVFLAGYVTYANAAKVRTLGVREESLREFGAVSEAVAREMAEGARRVSGADWALSVTGIAGPSGGTPDKPVGTVWMALAGPDGTEVVQRLNRFDRETFKFTTGQQALHLLFRQLRRPLRPAPSAVGPA